MTTSAERLKKLKSQLAKVSNDSKAVAQIIDRSGLVGGVAPVGEFVDVSELIPTADRTVFKEYGGYNVDLFLGRESTSGASGTSGIMTTLSIPAGQNATTVSVTTEDSDFVNGTAFVGIIESGSDGSEFLNGPIPTQLVSGAGVNVATAEINTTGITSIEVFIALGPALGNTQGRVSITDISAAQTVE